MNSQKQVHIPLTREGALALHRAILRRAELAAQAIVTRESEAESAALDAEIGETLSRHAVELLSAWFVVKNEYEPSINAFASLLGRANSILASRVAAAAAVNTQPAK